MEEDELRQEEPEWVESTLEATYKTTAVLCKTCSAVSPLKSHFPKGVFSLYCPKCRRRESQRKAQADWRKRNEVKHAKEALQLVKHRKNVRMRMAKLQRAERAKLEKLEAALQGENPHPALKYWHAYRKDKVARLDQARQFMERHLYTDNARPLPYYLEFAAGLVSIDADIEELRREMYDARGESQRED